MKSQQEYMKNVSTIYLFSQFQLNSPSMPFLFAFYMLISQQNSTTPVRPAESINAKTEVFFMQVGQQRPPVADCFHRRSYLFMLSHFHFSDMVVFLTHQPFLTLPTAKAGGFLFLPPLH